MMTCTQPSEDPWMRACLSWAVESASCRWDGIRKDQFMPYRFRHACFGAVCVCDMWVLLSVRSCSQGMVFFMQGMDVLKARDGCPCKEWMFLMHWCRLCKNNHLDAKPCMRQRRHARRCTHFLPSRQKP